MGRLHGGSATGAADKTLWRTPPGLVRAVFERHGFPEIDAAATDRSVALGTDGWLSPKEDALDPRPWASRARYTGAKPAGPPLAWLNPPWSAEPRGTGTWVRRALSECRQLRVRGVLLLVPEAPDTHWWWEAANVASVVYSLGRVRYLRPSGEEGPVPPQGSTLFVVLSGDKARTNICALIRWREWARPAGQGDTSPLEARDTP